jgi:hypothetical protein
MSLITQVSTSNTFNDWLNTTIDIVDTLNSLTEGGNASIFFVNTNLQIANNLVVSGNVIVTGNIVLDNIGFNDLTVAGNATINGTITGANTTLQNLIVSQNIARANITTSLHVGTTANISGNLTVSQNTTLSNLVVSNNFISGTSNVQVLNLNLTGNIQTANVTTKLEVGTDATIYGNLNVFGNTTLGNITATVANIQTANVVSLVGQANTEIYTLINDTLGATANANLAVEFLAFSLIFG